MMKSLSFLFLVSLGMLSFKTKAQVTTTLVSGPAVCDATATIYSLFETSPYEWFDSSGNSLGSDVPTISNLCPGNYTLNYIDSSGIASSYSFSIENYNPCAGFSALVTVLQNTPSGVCIGEAIISVTGGTAPYSYNFAGVTSASPTLNALCEGAGTVVVTDAAGCTANTTFFIYPDSVISSGSLSGHTYEYDETSSGACDGVAYVTAFGGTAPYTYLFSDGSTANPASNQCAGVYNVVVTDYTGASITLPYIIASATYSSGIMDSTVLDTLSGGIYEDCSIVYESIDSAGVLGWTPVTPDSVLITWFITSPSGTHSFSTIIYMPGVANYAVEVGVYCPTKSSSSFIRIYGLLNENNQLALNEQNTLSAQVYPNPYVDHLTIHLKEINDYTVSVIDMTGREVLNEFYRATSTIGILNERFVGQGEYILLISSDKGIFRTKIVK